MTHKEMTARIRNRIKQAGVKAKVSMQDICGSAVIYVRVPSYGITFSDEEQRTIRFIAKVNKLTWVQGQEIDVDRMTDPEGMKFFTAP
jgi:hypothetical protein